MLIVRILDESLGLFKDEVAERQTASGVWTTGRNLHMESNEGHWF
jgi:hypothetical protein